MTSAGLGLAALLFLIGAAAAASLPRPLLHFEERVLVGIVAMLLLSSAVTYVLALIAGLSAATVLGGAALTAAMLAGAVWPRRADALVAWREACAQLVSPAQRRHLVGLGVTALVAVAIVVALFVHTMTVSPAGDVNAGFQTVWADWSQHLTTSSSFVNGANLPPQNPLFSGQDLRYPFLPDFQSATLVVLGASPPAALAVPGAVLAMCVVLLVATLSVRLGAGLVAGVIAAAICMIGGGLGFTGVLSDACLHHGFAASQCTWSGFVSHPADIPSILAGTVHDVPGVIAAQSRAYDGLLTAAKDQPLPNQQWYTPLFAWWLPQRSILYGFAGALAVLTLVIAACRTPRRGLESFALAGLLLGLMPLIHIHTLIAMAIVLAILAVQWRHRGWLLTLAVTAVVAAPRLVTLVGGPTGSPLFGNAFPTVEPGWMYLGGGGDRPALSPVSLFEGIGGLLRALVSPQYWGFWIANTGIAVPLCVVLVIAVAASRLRGRAGAAARRVAEVFPGDLLRVALPFVAVFAVANLVVFQSWDWDNTKLLAYWYLGAALLIGTLVVRLWRRWWRGVAGVVIAGSVLLTGIVVLLRLLPWTPPEFAVGGPYLTASSDEVALATKVAQVAPHGSVFLTEGRPNDPLLMFGGRTAVLGYYGWLWSYGTDFGTRYTDVRTMLEGCTAQSASSCTVVSLLQQYNVSFVEIDDRVTSPGVIDPNIGIRWWASQGYPVVGSTQHITVYDVRSR